MEWNYHFGNFPYYFNARAGGQGVSSGTGLTLADPQAWYYWHTGKPGYLNQLDQYVTSGINGGEMPYGEFSQWTGQFEGRYYLFIKNTSRTDTARPPAIADLTATVASGVTTLAWTAPADAVHYHIVWSTLPIVEANSTTPGVKNWWAANVVGPNLTPAPGTRQTLTIATGDVSPVYAAIFTFDAADNMSAMSNLALAGHTYRVYYVRPDGGSANSAPAGSMRRILAAEPASPAPGITRSGPCRPGRAAHPGRRHTDHRRGQLYDGLRRAGDRELRQRSPGIASCRRSPAGPTPHTPRASLARAGYWLCGIARAVGDRAALDILNLTDASNVEIACLEITDHSSCVEFHSGGLACERDTHPFGPWASTGVYAEDSTDAYLHDLNIHGLANAGFHAGRLTDWTVEDVRIAGNGWVGWDGDLDGR